MKNLGKKMTYSVIGFSMAALSLLAPHQGTAAVTSDEYGVQKTYTGQAGTIVTSGKFGDEYFYCAKGTNDCNAIKGLGQISDEEGTKISFEGGSLYDYDKDRTVTVTCNDGSVKSFTEKDSHGGTFKLNPLPAEWEIQGAAQFGSKTVVYIANKNAKSPDYYKTMQVFEVVKGKIVKSETVANASRFRDGGTTILTLSDGRDLVFPTPFHPERQPTLGGQQGERIDRKEARETLEMVLPAVPKSSSKPLCPTGPQ